MEEKKPLLLEYQTPQSRGIGIVRRALGCVVSAGLIFLGMMLWWAAIAAAVDRDPDAGSLFFWGAVLLSFGGWYARTLYRLTHQQQSPATFLFPAADHE